LYFSTGFLTIIEEGSLMLEDIIEEVTTRTDSPGSKVARLLLQGYPLVTGCAVFGESEAISGVQGSLARFAGKHCIPETCIWRVDLTSEPGIEKLLYII
jgi:hypothetical protein